MKRYRNLSGHSGVTAYEIAPQAVTVQFAGGDVYVYSYASAGAANVEAMKHHALSGRGLATFITQHVRHAYESKR